MITLLISAICICLVILLIKHNYVINKLYYEAFNTQAIKCYYFYDDNQAMLKDCFEKSLHNAMPHVELHPVKFNYKSQSSNFGTLDFRNLMLEKVSRVKDIIESHIPNGTHILISDIDIIVYDNFEHLLKLDDDKDILFQKEHSNGPNDSINTGFIYLKCSPKTLQLWAEVEQHMKSHSDGVFINEQAIINNIVSEHDIKWDLFDDSIWAYSNNPKPDKIYLHHANVTAPIENKTSLQLKCRQMIDILTQSSLQIKDEIINILSKYL
jgi:uncharacterized protein YdcH (DUF465 family)